LGCINTPRGTVDTPNFIFCGTKATVKGVTVDQLRSVNTSIILSNTYHLMLQPGADVIAALGGLHQFCGWDGPMLTDSGGYQIFAMGHGSVAEEIKGNRSKPKDAKATPPRSLLRVSDEGAVFRAHTDGRHITLTPEESIAIQRKLGADLIVQLDECTPFHVDRDYTERSMHLSHRWGDRSLAAFIDGNDGRQALYAVVQGGVYPDLRKQSGAYTASRPFFGTCIGGSLGASKEQMYEVISFTIPYIAPDRPVHLLGIGGVDDIFAGVAMGIDTFDCVSPTRIARHGWAIVPQVPGNRLNLRNSRFKTDSRPIDPDSGCLATRTLSRGYLHHLLKAQETLGAQLISMHNIAQMNRLMRDIRTGIANDMLADVERFWLG
jgi:queuine tRNA-ribosyltransferase